jgi:hypothetical protein
VESRIPLHDGGKKRRVAVSHLPQHVPGQHHRRQTEPAALPEERGHIPGVPFNIASYALLTLILAKVTGYEPGEFVHTFGDVHIYEMHLAQVKEQLSRTPNAFPRIKFNREFRTIDEFRPEYVELVDYVAHPPIKAALSVTGGLYDNTLKILKSQKKP